MWYYSINPQLQKSQTYDDYGSLAQTSVFLVQSFNSQLVRLELDLKHPVLLLQALDALLQLFPRDGAGRHHDGATIDAAGVRLAGRISHDKSPTERACFSLT